MSDENRNPNDGIAKDRGGYKINLKSGESKEYGQYGGFGGISEGSDDGLGTNSLVGSSADEFPCQTCKKKTLHKQKPDGWWCSLCGTGNTPATENDPDVAVDPDFTHTGNHYVEMTGPWTKIGTKTAGGKNIDKELKELFKRLRVQQKRTTSAAENRRLNHRHTYETIRLQFFDNLPSSVKQMAEQIWQHAISSATFQGREIKIIILTIYKLSCRIHKLDLDLESAISEFEDPNSAFGRDYSTNIQTGLAKKGTRFKIKNRIKSRVLIRRENKIYF